MLVILLGSQGALPAWAAAVGSAGNSAGRPHGGPSAGGGTAGGGTGGVNGGATGGAASVMTAKLMPIGMLTGITTIGALQAEVLKSVSGPFAEFFRTHFKDHLQQKIEIRRVKGDEYLLRVDHRQIAIEFSDRESADNAVRINKKLIQIDWNGQPENELKKVEEALPKLARLYLPGLSPLFMALTTGEEARAFLYPVAALAALGVGAVGLRTFSCNRIESAGKKCEQFEKMSSEEKAAIADRPAQNESELQYLQVLDTAWTCAAKRDALVQCLERRGFNMPSNKAGSGSVKSGAGAATRESSQ